MALFLIQQSCTRTLNDILCHSVYISVADPDLQIRGGGGGGPCPGSATTSNPLCRTKVRQTLKCFFCDKAILDDSQRDLSQLGSHSAYGSS